MVTFSEFHTGQKKLLIFFSKKFEKDHFLCYRFSNIADDFISAIISLAMGFFVYDDFYDFFYTIQKLLYRKIFVERITS